MIDEWCGAQPDVFVPMHIVPVWDVDLAVAETERMIDRGTKALCWMEDPANLGLPGYHTDYWYPLFAVCEEAGLPDVHAHRRCVAAGDAGRARSRWWRSPLRSRRRRARR